MQISFLSASDHTPLTKRFALENGSLTKTSYPMVRNFSSTTYDIDTIQQFYDKTIEHAEQGDCLLKGKLNRVLSSESRAGSTSSIDSTQWVLFDLDNIIGFTSVEDFIHSVLSPEFHDCSYIVHMSSSAGIKDNEALNCHLAFFLDREMPAPILKVYLEQLNYTSAALHPQLELSACGSSMKYPLDITTCQNDKLIFIAPPVFDGLDDPVAERIRLVQKGSDHVQLALPTVNPEIVRNTKDELIAQLRKAAGLKAKKIQYKSQGEIEYVANPDEAAITGVRKARGFVYLNLNGGDSWAYYFPEDNPEFVFSFKEPGIAYRLKDINSHYYRSYKSEMGQTQDKELPEVVPFVFRDLRTDQYYNGTYNTVTGKHDVHKVSTKSRMTDFMLNHGQEMPKRVEDWTRVFDPTNPRTINFSNKWINTYVPTEYVLKPNVDVTEPPELISRIIKHVVDYDLDAYDNFINWLACVFQYRTKIGTAWVFTGTEGTGKGLLFDYIIKPILGAAYCPQKGMETIEESFNAWIETCLVMNFNEARLVDSKQVSRILNKLKNMITEPYLTVRGMRQDGFEVPSYCNLIFTSNYNDAIKLSLEDRRFWVAPRQNQKLIITQEEVESLKDMLFDFAGYLANYDTDLSRARNIELNDAKIEMANASQTSHDQYFAALEKGDLDFFAQFLTTQPDTDSAYSYYEYEAVIKRWLEGRGAPMKCYREEFHLVYNYIQNDRYKMSQNKFVRACTHNNLTLKKMRRHDDSSFTTGLEITWECDPEMAEAWLAPPTPASETEATPE